MTKSNYVKCSEVFVGEAEFSKYITIDDAGFDEYTEGKFVQNGVGCCSVFVCKAYYTYRGVIRGLSICDKKIINRLNMDEIPMLDFQMSIESRYVGFFNGIKGFTDDEWVDFCKNTKQFTSGVSLTNQGYFANVGRDIITCKVRVRQDGKYAEIWFDDINNKKEMLKVG